MGNFTEKEILMSIDFILSERETGLILSGDISENSDFISFGGDIQVYLISLLFKNIIDRKYFFALLKKYKTHKLFLAQHLMMFLQIVQKIYYTIKKDDESLVFNNIENYIFVLSDLLMLALLNVQIEQEKYDTLKKEMHEIIEEIKLKKITITKPLDDLSMMIKFYKNSNRDDFLIEKIKI